MTITARRRRAAGEVVEWALVGPIVILLVFGILSFGYTAWQRSVIDYELSRLGEELPSDWASYSNKNALVKEMILSGSTLDADKLTVKNASVKELSSSTSETSGSSATSLGDVVSRSSKRVLVTADVTYDATGFLALGGRVEYSAKVSGTYLTERRFEVS